MPKRRCNPPMPAFAGLHPNLLTKGQCDSASGTRRYCRYRALAPNAARQCEYLTRESHWSSQAPALARTYFVQRTALSVSMLAIRIHIFCVL